MTFKRVLQKVSRAFCISSKTGVFELKGLFEELNSSHFKTHARLFFDLKGLKALLVAAHLGGLALGVVVKAHFDGLGRAGL